MTDGQPLDVRIHRLAVEPAPAAAAVGSEHNPFLPPAATAATNDDDDTNAPSALAAMTTPLDSSLDSAAAPHAASPPPVGLTRHQTRAASYLGVCFCLLFSAFQPAQAFFGSGGSFVGGVGFLSLGLCYPCFFRYGLYYVLLFYVFGL